MLVCGQWQRPSREVATSNFSYRFSLLPTAPCRVLPCAFSALVEAPVLRCFPFRDCRMLRAAPVHGQVSAAAGLSVSHVARVIARACSDTSPLRLTYCFGKRLGAFGDRVLKSRPVSTSTEALVRPHCAGGVRVGGQCLFKGLFVSLSPFRMSPSCLRTLRRSPYPPSAALWCFLPSTILLTKFSHCVGVVLCLESNIILVSQRLPHLHLRLSICRWVISLSPRVDGSVLMLHDLPAIGKDNCTVNSAALRMGPTLTSNCGCCSILSPIS